jgi:uncharacterized protein YjbI with pentapeptide repeats
MSSLWLFSFPGEPHINLFGGNSISAVQCDRKISQNFDRLQVPFEDIRKRDLSGRDLSCGMFIAARLPETDFSYAQLQGANLTGAELQGAFFNSAQLQGTTLMGAQLQGARLLGAWLQGADLTGARVGGELATLA